MNAMKHFLYSSLFFLLCPVCYVCGQALPSDTGVTDTVTSYLVQVAWNGHYANARLRPCEASRLLVAKMPFTVSVEQWKSSVITAKMNLLPESDAPSVNIGQGDILYSPLQQQLLIVYDTIVMNLSAIKLGTVGGEIDHMAYYYGDVSFKLLKTIY